MVAYTLTQGNIFHSFVAFDSFTESGSTGTDGHCFHGLYLDHIQLWGCALYHLHPDSLSRGREAGPGHWGTGLPVPSWLPVTPLEAVFLPLSLSLLHFFFLSFSTHAPSPDVYSLTYVLPSPIYSLLSSHTAPTFKSTRQRPQVRVGKAGEGKEEQSLNQQNRFSGLWNLLSVPVWVIFFKGNTTDLHSVLPSAAQRSDSVRHIYTF